jgi:hypothetical protein
MNDKTQPVADQGAHDEETSQPAATEPVRQAGASEFTPVRAEADMDTGGEDSGEGDATPGEPTGGEILNGSPTQQPREDTRIGEPSSQGLAGAQGSGGGAERGPNRLV